MYACKFPGSRPLGKPRDWDESLDGPYGTIHITETVDTLTGLNVMYSCYKPADDEIEAWPECEPFTKGIVPAKPANLPMIQPERLNELFDLPAGDK